jgi:DNA modification methylase
MTMTMKTAEPIVNRLFVGDAASVLTIIPARSIDLIVTSPPYWTAVSYSVEHPWHSYEEYLADLQTVWVQCARVLRPNGKLCIVAPLMPIPKNLMPGVTRHLKNIAGDIDRGIVEGTYLQFYDQQKQTSKLMLGAYPYPGNNYACNTVEFINIYVRPGDPPKFPDAVKEANRIDTEHRDLTQQVWFMMPHDIPRLEGHPAPFPVEATGALDQALHLRRRRRLPRRDHPRSLRRHRHDLRRRQAHGAQIYRDRHQSNLR